MGNSLRCLALWRSRNDGSSDDAPVAAPLLLQAGDVLEKLPPNHRVNRLVAALPNITISMKTFADIQQLLPVHHRSLKWEQMFSSEECGFSTQSLMAACREHGKHHDAAGVLLIKTAADRVIGVYFPYGIDWNVKKYYGTNGTIVFSVDQQEVIKSFATSGSNDYFLRTSTNGEISVGGGGRGPAIKVLNDLLEVQSSTECPTFADYTCLLPLDSAAVVEEAGTVQTGVLAVEFWSFSNSSF